MRNLGALSKEFCIRCCNENFLRDSNSPQWNKEDDERWKEDVDVHCPDKYYDGDYGDETPPKACPYQLEHMLATQKKPISRG